MINRKHRFHGHNSLHYVYQHGKTIRGTLTSLKYAENTRRDTYRLAVVVSKKVSKSAVFRNRLRRRIYEVVRLAETQISVPYDMVITVYSEKLADLAYDKYEQLILQQLKQAHILPAKTTPVHAKIKPEGE